MSLRERVQKRRWLVTVEVTKHHYVMARTVEEAMRICERRYVGEPYDAQLAYDLDRSGENGDE